MIRGPVLPPIAPLSPTRLPRARRKKRMNDFPFKTSYWFDSQIATSPSLSGAQFADVAVVGGGFAGLSAVQHLKSSTPNLSVALVEAKHIGFGASGRNAGVTSVGLLNSAETTSFNWADGSQTKRSIARGLHHGMSLPLGTSWNWPPFAGSCSATRRSASTASSSRRKR
jgi:hypothetical protein